MEKRKAHTLAPSRLSKSTVDAFPGIVNQSTIQSTNPTQLAIWYNMENVRKNQKCLICTGLILKYRSYMALGWTDKHIDFVMINILFNGYTLNQQQSAQQRKFE